MQAIKEKLSDMSAMRQAKAEAKEEEREEKELAKARLDVAHEVRLAREAEAAMDLHVNKAAEKVTQHEMKHHLDNPTGYSGHGEANAGSLMHGGGSKPMHGGGSNPMHSGDSNPMHDKGSNPTQSGRANEPLFRGVGESTGLPAYGGGDPDYHGGKARNTASTMTNNTAGTGYTGNAPSAR